MSTDPSKLQVFQLPQLNFTLHSGHGSEKYAYVEF